MTGEEVKLGSKMRDTITGLEGTVVCKTEWLNGCWRITLQPKEVKDGKPVDTYTVDVEQLELVEEAAPAAAPKRTGGDRPSISRAADPR